LENTDDDLYGLSPAQVLCLVLKRSAQYRKHDCTVPTENEGTEMVAEWEEEAKMIEKCSYPLRKGYQRKI
jgi:hypothetical protein